MTEHEHLHDTDRDAAWRKARDLLGGSAEHGWIFGVCATIASRSGWELWAVRAVALVLLLVFWWVPVAIAYLIIAIVLDETRPATQTKLSRWARRADDLLEIIWTGLRRLFNRRRDETYSPRDGLV